MSPKQRAGHKTCFLFWLFLWLFVNSWGKKDKKFRGKKQYPFSIAPFPRPFGLEPATSTAG
jgi:hypothetical protein